MIQTQDIEAVDGHGGESLVDLDDIDVILGELELGKELWDRNRGADAHNAWRNTGDGRAAELGHDWLPKLDGFAALHEQNRGSCKNLDQQKL
jgi:hypothetical protein